MLALISLLAVGGTAALAADKPDIKIGQTQSYSGPASSYGAIGLTQAAYFDMINAQGGINGHKIVFLSVDDGYSPPRTVEKNSKIGGAGGRDHPVQLAGHADQLGGAEIT